MKRILAILLVLCVAVTMFVACGEKKEEPTTDTTTTTTETTTDNTTTTETTEKPADTTMPAAFEGKFFTIGTLPTGWKATETEGVVTIAKENDMLKTIYAMVIENVPVTVEQLADETSKKLEGSTVEDTTIGANTFKKITATVAGNEVVNLIAVANGTAFNFTVNNFADPDIQAILSSIVLK